MDRQTAKEEPRSNSGDHENVEDVDAGQDASGSTSRESRTNLHRASLPTSTNVQEDTRTQEDTPTQGLNSIDNGINESETRVGKDAKSSARILHFLDPKRRSPRTIDDDSAVLAQPKPAVRLHFLDPKRRIDTGPGTVGGDSDVLDQPEPNDTRENAATTSPVPLSTLPAISRPGAYAAQPGAMEFQARTTTETNDTTIAQENENWNDVHDTSVTGSPENLPNRDTPLVDDSMLAVARPVNETASENLVIADEEIDLEQQEHRRQLRAKRQQRRSLIAVCLFVVVVGLAVGLVVGVLLSRNDQVPTEDTTRATAAPSSVPSNPPTPSPTQDPLAKLKASLPGYTRSSMENKLSPQSKAFDWLSNHTRLDEFEEWRRVQLFALATFFFSMGGPEWPKDVKEHWRQYDVSECDWHSGWFGEFDTHGGYQQAAEENRRTSPCNNETGKFESLFIEGFNIFSLDPVLPPEIELLTSLNEIILVALGIGGSLYNWLPTILFNMSHIESIWLYNNSFTGTIPSELFQMSQLKEWSLHNNSLSGEMPTEIGSLSSLERLFLGQNPSFTASSIPSEIWNLSNLTRLGLENTNCVGAIASEIGLLSNLEILDLVSNSLTGRIPERLSHRIEHFDLSDNSLTGTQV